MVNPHPYLIMTIETPSDPHQSSLETAEELREDLETIAQSDLPFAYDADRILEALERQKDD